MIAVELGELPELRCVAGSPNVTVTGLAVDSRLVEPGALFVAIPGRNLDGHDFVDDAVVRGAAAVACAPGRGRPVDRASVFEAAPLAALAAVAGRVRDKSGATVVAVAGSAGKTSTKDILACLCAPVVRTVAAPESFNNEIGVPLTLARVQPDTELVVCELGTGGPGEVAYLAAVARPRVGVITAVGPEHLESFGSLEAAAAAEAELIAALPAGGTLVLPYGEPLLEPHRRRDLRQITFGDDPRADVQTPAWRPGKRYAEVAIRVLGELVSFRTNLLARYQRLNLSAALAVCHALGLPLQRVAGSAASIRLSRWRGQETRLSGGATLVNDAYNANPLSMEAALAALAERADGRRSVAVLGEMHELGADAARWHARVGAFAAQAGIDVLVAIGPLGRYYLDGRIPGREWLPDVHAAASVVPELLRPDDVVLLKGSRAAGIEALEDALDAAPGPAPAGLRRPRRLTGARGSGAGVPR